MALLEDSGWYKANFELAENSPFGLNMGCDFVEKDCIIDDKVPSHSHGFFCNNIDTAVEKCGVNYSFRGQCDLSYSATPQRGYFDNSIGPQFIHADYCPIIQKNVVDCDDQSAIKVDPIKNFMKRVGV